MLKHIVNSHPEQDPKEVHFGMKIIRTCKTSFERQVYESVAIQQEREQHHLLNSQSEYKRCSLPRLSTQLGENEYKKLNKELHNEKQQEDLIESKIRNLRKQRNRDKLGLNWAKLSTRWNWALLQLNSIKLMNKSSYRLN